MFKNKKLVKGLVSRIVKAEKITLRALENRNVEQEPAVTDRLLGAISHALDSQVIGGVMWTAKTLTDRGHGSQEGEFGADFMSVFKVDMDDFKIAKGFLAQAKLVEPAGTFSSSEFNRLLTQCEKMLQHSPSSFVFLYSNQSGVVVVPAHEVVAARPCNPHELTSLPMAKFYQEHFECFIGDTGIRSADPAGLDTLRQRYEARQLFLISGRSPRNVEGARLR